MFTKKGGLRITGVYATKIKGGIAWVYTVMLRFVQQLKMFKIQRPIV